MTHVQFLHNLIHEMVHSLSANTSFSLTKKYRTNHNLIEFSGYSRVQRGGNQEFEAFNEGVTERLTQEVLVEYLKQKGEFSTHKEDLDKLINTYLFKGEHSALLYGWYVQLIDLIIEKIALYANITETDVWNAIKRGYFTGDSLYEKETRELLELSISKKFLEKLSNVRNDNADKTLSSLIKTFFDWESDKIEDKWLSHLGLKKIYKPFLLPRH